MGGSGGLVGGWGGALSNGRVRSHQVNRCGSHSPQKIPPRASPDPAPTAWDVLQGPLYAPCSGPGVSPEVDPHTRCNGLLWVGQMTEQLQFCLSGRLAQSRLFVLLGCLDWSLL